MPTFPYSHPSASPCSRSSSTPNASRRCGYWSPMKFAALTFTAMSGIFSLANAHTSLAGTRLLPWSATASQVEVQSDLKRLNEQAPSNRLRAKEVAAERKTEASRRHDLTNQSVLGDGGQQTFDIHSDGNHLPPPELQFERSFLRELPEAADRESMEWRHDENG
jgi:hypothetical protein